MRIKKFNELFDSDDIKSQHEVEFLQGKNILKDINIPIDFKNESISYLLHKLAKFDFPFLSIFFDNPDGVFRNYETSIMSMDDGYWMFSIKSDDEITVSIGIKVNKTSDYDVFVYSSDDDGMEYKDLDYKELCDVIKDVYIPMLINNDFDILNYGGDTLEVSN